MKNAKRKFASLLDENRWASVNVSILSILLSLLCAGVLLMILGKNPMVAFRSFLQGAGFWPKAKYGAGTGLVTDFTAFLGMLGPLILASLSFIVGFKAGLFNIGIAGQMVASGFVATAIVGYSDLSSFVAKPLVILIGIAVGGIMGWFIGWLKYRFNIHEVVSTIMVSYIINYLVGFFINTYFLDGTTRNMRTCSAASRLTWTNLRIGDGNTFSIPLGIILAILAVILVKYIFDKTVFGFELKAVGSNAKCARYAGIKVGNRMIASMVFSGMLAGLAGVTYFCGYFNSIVTKVLPSMGYDAIAVALLGNASPVGAVFAAILVSIFQVGSNYMSSTLGVAKEIASLITGILLSFAACGGYFRYLAHRQLDRIADEELRLQRQAAAEEVEKEDEPHVK